VLNKCLEERSESTLDCLTRMGIPSGPLCESSTLLPVMWWFCSLRWRWLILLNMLSSRDRFIELSVALTVICLVLYHFRWLLGLKRTA
jgi:hypothetical protein